MKFRISARIFSANIWISLNVKLRDVIDKIWRFVLAKRVSSFFFFAASVKLSFTQKSHKICFDILNETNVLKTLENNRLGFDVGNDFVEDLMRIVFQVADLLFLAVDFVNFEEEICEETGDAVVARKSHGFHFGYD